MNEPHNHTINNISDEVKRILYSAEAGHDWWHVFRVWKNAQLILSKEAEANGLIVELAALLHDIADPKFHDGDESLAPKMAENIMRKARVLPEISEHVINIIKHMSFKNQWDGLSWTSLEMQIVQDADRLDAIGAIGIARAFTYGGYKGRIFLDPDVPPIRKMTKALYTSSASPTINHFYEKLLLLKDMMHTDTARSIAEERHRFMVDYLNQFYSEFGFTPEWVTSQ